MKSLLFKESEKLVLIITLIFVILSKIFPIKKCLIGYFLVMVFLYWFYRSPNRVKFTNSKEFIFSACDGKIIEITEENDNYRIATFLSPFNVHVQYYPYDGIITEKTYKTGEFNPAFYKKSKHNERSEITLKTDIGNITVIQIAGIFVKRIVAFHKVGDAVKQGEHLGLIKFGSRVDLIIPKKNIKLLVKVGDKIEGAITKIASIGIKK